MKPPLCPGTGRFATTWQEGPVGVRKAECPVCGRVVRLRGRSQLRAHQVAASVQGEMFEEAK